MDQNEIGEKQKPKGYFTLILFLNWFEHNANL